MNPTDARRTLRWGIVGTGVISKRIASDFAHTHRATLAAVCSRTAANADQFADEFDIPERYHNFGEMLDSNIDAVYIATPDFTHFALAAEALSRGCNVLCEKPLGLSAAEVRRLGIIARDTNSFLMEAMWMKFNPLYIKLLELIDAGSIGEVRSVRASFGAPVLNGGSGNLPRPSSALLTRGIYPVTLSHMILGSPSRVQAGGIGLPNGIDVSQYFTLIYPTGRFAQGASSMVEYLDQSASISGTSGWVEIGPGFWFASQLTLHRNEGGRLSSETHTVQLEGHGYVPMLREVTAAILEGSREHVLHSLEETTRVFESLDAIRAQVFVEPAP